jgi:hypothetical protein
MSGQITNIRIACATVIGVFLASVAYSQSGCTDPQATNYDISAIDNDGSCDYELTNQVLEQIYILSQANPNLGENSGIELDSEGGLWIHNDGGMGSIIMKLEEPTGYLDQTLDLWPVQNIDWEDMAQSPDHLFLGDFGNNLSGDREDLVIYRVDKSDIGIEDFLVLTSEQIEFSYPEQGVPEWAPADSTNWDCEAMFWHNGAIHLFTKNWLNYETNHYVIPDEPGVHEAELVESFNVQGLITAADVTDDGTIVLLGYTLIGQNFMWMLWDYQADLYFSGNKRRIELGLALTNGQTEGIVFNSPTSGYISAERFILGDFINIPPQLLSFEIDSYITGIEEAKSPNYSFWPNPVFDELNTDIVGLHNCQVRSVSGQLVRNVNLVNGQIDLTDVAQGAYILSIDELLVNYSFIKN